MRKILNEALFTLVGAVAIGAVGYCYFYFVGYIASLI